MKKTLFTLIALGAITASANAAIIAGDIIGIDFGTDDGSQTNFNVIATPADVTLEDVIRVSDGTALSGVDFTFVNVNNGNSGANNSPDIAPNFDLGDAAEGDGFFEGGVDGVTNVGQWTLTFTGLNDSLTYDLTIGSQWATGTATQNENRDTGWQVGATQLATDADSDTGSYVTFSDITSSGGTLTISTYDLNSNTISTLSALTLTAIPEPSSFALLAGLFGLTHIMLRRRR